MEYNFYKTEYGNQIYAVSTPMWAAVEQDGEAIMQTWVIAGKERVMAIDSPIPAIEGFREYLEKEFKLPVTMMNTHGHIDHTGCNEQFSEIWLNERDWPLLLGGGIKPFEGAIDITGLSYKLNKVKDYEEIDLGNRRLLAIPIKGHTLGSMMMYDETTKSLFSGDSIARRILYGLSGWTPMSEYLSAIKSLGKYDIKDIYSMHDAFVLPEDFPQRIIKNIIENLQLTNRKWTMPDSDIEFLHILLGEAESEPSFFSFVMPLERKEEVLIDLLEHGFMP